MLRSLFNSVSFHDTRYCSTCPRSVFYAAFIWMVITVGTHFRSSSPGVDYTAKSGYALDGVSQKDAWLHGESHNKREYLLYNFYYKVDNYAFTEVQNAPLAVRYDSRSVEEPMPTVLQFGGESVFG